MARPPAFRPLYLAVLAALVSPGAQADGYLPLLIADYSGDTTSAWTIVSADGEQKMEPDIWAQLPDNASGVTIFNARPGESPGSIKLSLMAGSEGPASLPISILRSGIEQAVSGLSYIINASDPTHYASNPPSLPPIGLQLYIDSTTILSDSLQLAFPDRTAGDWQSPSPIPGAVSVFGVGFNGNINLASARRTDLNPTANDIHVTVQQDARIGLVNASSSVQARLTNTSLPWNAAGAAIVAHSRGGAGYGEDGPGGSGGNVSVTLQPGSVIELTGVRASPNAHVAGVLALSQGGIQGAGYNQHGGGNLTIADAPGTEVQGKAVQSYGEPGWSNSVTVKGDGASVTSDSPYTVGILAASVGGSLQVQPYSDLEHNTDIVTVRGSQADVSVVLNSSSIEMNSSNTIGVMAISSIDEAIVENRLLLASASLGPAASANVSLDSNSQVSVGNLNGPLAANGASDTTVGVVAATSTGWAHGIFSGQSATAFANGHPVNQPPSGDASESHVNVTNQGRINAWGNSAIGILAQSVGGTGASINAEQSGTADVGKPADIGSNWPGNGGTVTVTQDGGRVTTRGDGGIGVLAQSIGGSGGNGANAKGAFVAVGGSGANGGAGGKVVFDQRGNGGVITQGDYAQGVLLQSIGGGGGNGGYAKSYSVIIPVSTAVGGKGGAGGAGGNIVVGGSSGGKNSAIINTDGQHAHGLVAHSIGGGGGTGGAANAYDAGIINIAVASGGAGGQGGDGGNITDAGGSGMASSVGHVLTRGHDAHGLLLQSIGGGGGVAGGSTADTFSALNFLEIPTVNVAVALGASGAPAGNGGLINFGLLDSVTTQGALAHGLTAQSIGGGGGLGGDATAGTAAFLQAPSFTLNTSVGVGGTGGAGGSGGSVSLSIGNQVTTSGHHSVGVLAQSIGGGGGVGGVGNAASVTGGSLSESTLQVDVGVGGRGGSGARGGDVSIATQSGAAINVRGGAAAGIVAQSVGGGGGVGGNAGSQGVGGKLKLSTVVGGSGGSGNHGGNVNVGYAGQILTGDLFQLQYADKAGAKQLTTPVVVGSGAHGILAQSVGGGGGVGGNADPTASIVPDLFGSIVDDVNKVLDARNAIGWWAKKIVDYDTEEFEFPKEYRLSAAVGGSGGAAGDGGDVTVAIGANTTIGTLGHGSYAVLAQSVGGGGGTAGVSGGESLIDVDAGISPVTGADFGATINVGGSPGGGGDGGDVTVTVSNLGGGQTHRLYTAGYGAHIVVAQSIAGGGGVAHDGSMVGFSGKVAGIATPDLTLGAVDNSRNGASGTAGAVSIGTSSTPLAGLFENAGDASSVLVAQSIGGGGGIANFGCTNSGRAQGAVVASACYTNTASAGAAGSKYMPERFGNASQSYALNIASNLQAGNGGPVNLVLGDAGLHTTGDRSIAIVAQSIGGGGGLALADRMNVTGTRMLSGGGGRGDNITISLANTEVTASGHGSWGILAQSISQGGGLLGDTSADFLAPSRVLASQWVDSSEASGEISLALDGQSKVSVGRDAQSVNAHAIVLQSLGSGGGVMAGSGQSDAASLQLGAFDASPVSGVAGAIRVNTAAGSVVETAAIGGIGLLAQSAGYAAGDGNNPSFIDVVINGTVTGGKTGVNPRSGRTLDGIGVALDGGVFAGNSYNQANTLTVGSGGLITTQGGTDSGYAIKVFSGLTNVTNSGTITGSIDLGDTPGTLVNQAGGVLNKGAVYNVGDSSLHNYGTLNIGLASGVGTTVVNGRLNQYEGGRTVVTIDAANAQAANDRLVVNGVANVGGVLEVQANSLLPGSYTVLQASDLTFTGTVQDALLFDWSAEQQGESLALRPSARLGLAGLDASAASLADYLQRGWLRSDAGKARVFGYLNQLGSLNQYRSTLQQLGGQQLHSQPQQMVAMAYDSFSDGMQCPLFQTPGVAMSQSGCAWARVTGNRSDQSARDYNLGYRSEGGGLRLGVQRELGNQWRLGATFGANLNRLTADGFSSKGQVYDLSVSLSRQVGQWTFTGALAGAYGSFRNDRTPQLGAAGTALGLNSTYSSRSSTTLFGARLRAAYDIPFQNSYLRPYLDVDLLHTRSPSFSESNGPLGLAVGSVSKTQVVVSPMLEVGTRYDLSHDTVLRAYASAGVSVLPDNERTSQNRFTGALGAAGSFDSRLEGPSAVGRLNLGVQVLNKNGLELNAEYGLQAGGSFRSQTIGARLTYRF